MSHQQILQQRSNITMDSPNKKRNKLVYPLCPIHLDENLQLVCLTCSDHSLACPLCIDTGHHLHQVISLKKFLSSQVSKMYQEQPNFDLMEQKLSILSQHSIQCIEKMRKQIGHEINQLQNYFMERAETFQNQLKFIYGIYTHQSAQKLSDNVQAAKIKIKKGAKIPKNSELADKILLNQTLMEQTFSEACVDIRRIIFGLKQFCTASSDLFLNSKYLNNKHFDKGNRHQSMEILDHGAKIVNKQYDNSYHSCISQPALSPFRNSVVFRILKTQHKCIWVGITDLKSIKEANFVNLYKNSGRHYMIWQAGGQGSAQFYAQDFEDRPMIGWNFQEGDRITVRIITSESNQNKYVEFVKNQGGSDEQPLKYVSKISKQIGIYYACIGLGDIGESVEIVNIV